MGEFDAGQYIGDDAETILDAMIADAEEYWGVELNTTERSNVRRFYRPIANLLASFQDELSVVLESAQIDNAEGKQLDLLTSLIGINRRPDKPATGEVEFSRSSPASTDYIIPEGVEVQVDSNDPEKYETIESGKISSGETSETLSVKSVDTGEKTNTASNTVTVIPSPPAGVESVTNPQKISGGIDQESDDELRGRAKNEVSDGNRASSSALYSSVQALENVTSVSIFTNDSSTDNTGSGGLPSHSFEIVANGGDVDNIAQTILETKAAGDTAYGGANGTAVSGTAELPNGQTVTIDFSRPEVVQIHIDASLEVTENFEGTDAVLSSIARYIGGKLPSGSNTKGELNVGDDVIYGEVEYAIRSVDGVYDVTDLFIGTSSSPTSTSNISIAANKISEVDAVDGSVSISTNQV